MNDYLAMLRRDFTRHLGNRNKASNTVRLYGSALDRLIDTVGAVADLGEITKRQLEEHFGQRAAATSPATANVEYRGVQQFFRWALEEELVTVSPMALMKPMQAPEKLIPLLTLDQLRALLDLCKGREFVQLRDTTLFRLLADTGGRLSEIANLTVVEVDFDMEVVHVVGKGSRPRALPFGGNTGTALARYLRKRAQQKNAAKPHLWLAEKGRGPLTFEGIKQMLRRRGTAIGLPKLHAHQFRHTAAHEWMAQGASETDLMRIMGWRSPQMLRRYGASAADERARETHKRLALGDRI